MIKNLPYTDCDGRKLRLDLYRPADGAGPWPVILWVCGGGWRGCSKDDPPRWLAECGFALASIEYRVSGEAIAPANIHDCKAAVRWLRAHAGEHRLDPERIGAWGGSAGGHLVALLGVSHGVAELEGTGGNPDWSSAVRAACDFCGPSDLTRMAIPAVRQRFAVLYEVTAQYLGGPVEERLDLARLVSPITYASKSSPPLLIVHGQDDDVVPVEESLELHEALQQAGADVTLQVRERTGHGLDVQARDDLVLAFFRRTL
ncbi:alpha/beta hydrolase [bacterium]|nr:alpha/beta hydrolase [bacterium]